MLFTGGGFFVWWVIDVLILLTGRFKDGEGRVLGPPRHIKRQPAGRLENRQQRQPLSKADSKPDDISVDDLLEDPLACEFEKLEREMSTDGTP